MVERGTQRILIVDDEPAVRMTLELALAETPHQVDSVDTAEKALAALADRPYDLLIVDKNLPGINGVELIRRVRQQGEDVWAAMITGYPSAESAMEMLHLGVRGYLEKPFDDIFEVVRRVESILAAKRTQERLRDAVGRMQRAAEQVPSPRALRIVLVPASDDERAWLLVRTGGEADTVLAAQTGNDALALVAVQVPDIVICDAGVRDPELFTFVRALRVTAPDVRLVVICDSPSLKILTELIDARTTAVISRPLTDSTYRGRMEGVLMRLRMAPVVNRTVADAG